MTHGDSRTTPHRRNDAICLQLARGCGEGCRGDIGGDALNRTRMYRGGNGTARRRIMPRGDKSGAGYVEAASISGEGEEKWRRRRHLIHAVASAAAKIS